MKILGKQMSKWWLLLIPPLLLLSLPVLLMLFFMGNNIVGAIIGPPAIWNRPWNAPSHADLVGKYSEDRPRLLNQIELPRASIVLNNDGSTIVNNLPCEMVETYCSLEGKGRWSVTVDDNQIDLALNCNRPNGSCESSGYSSLQIAGHSKPYMLYWVKGDPDSGEGIWLKKEN